MDQTFRENTNKLRTDFLEHVDSKLCELIDGLVVGPREMNDSHNVSELSNSLLLSPAILSSDKQRSTTGGSLPEKVFCNRDSPLTELLRVPHFKTIHHIFIATLSLFMIHTLVIDLLHTGTLDFGVDMLLWAFGSRQTVLFFFIFMNLTAMLVLYPAFHFWATLRHDFELVVRKKVDRITAGIFLMFLLCFIFIPATILWMNPLPPASGAAVTMEQMRLMMKMYAFVRSCAPRVLAQDIPINRFKPESLDITDNICETPNGLTETPSAFLRKRTIQVHSVGSEQRRIRSKRRESWIRWDEEESGCPGFSKYVYFLCAPTLIYKDSYPMRDKIRWEYVCWNFGQFLGCIVYANFLLSRFGGTFFSKFGHPDHRMNLTQLIDALFSMMLPGIMCLILSFFMLLHAWHNAFAEMLYFGDRMFYKDWWNSSSFSVYYKTWNLIVHDWLYTYIFKDACELGLGKIWRPLPTTLVFLVSSLFHEYILCFSFNFFFPVLLTFFGGVGFALVFIKGSKTAFGNILMWMSLISGTGTITTFYTMEYYARLNCPPSPRFDFFIPRALTCNAFTMSLS